MASDKTPAPNLPERGAALPQGQAKGRIAPAIRAAIKLRLEEGLTIKEASARAGISEAGWYLAMQRPHVAAAYEAAEVQFIQTVERRRKQYMARDIEVAAELMERGKSEQVRMRAVEFFSREAPAPASPVTVNINAAGGYDYPRPDTLSGAIEGQAIDVTGKSQAPKD